MANIILNFGRCSHGRCIFCGYGRIRGEYPTPQAVNACLDRFFDGLRDDEVKVFGSGSFLDVRQIPEESRIHFIKRCKEKKVRSVTVESRPEYVNEGVLSEFRGLDLTVAMGLESADDTLLEKLQKGFGRREYEEAASLIHRLGFKVRTYLLVNPPYVEDPGVSLDGSVKYALEKSDSVVLINLIPHSSAPLTKMWLEGRWRFFSKEEFGKATKKWAKDPRVEVDFETFSFKPNIPQHLRHDLRGVGEWYLTNPHFEVWHDYLIRWYTPPNGKVLLFLPCAYTKPYSRSKTHQRIIAALGENRGLFHEVMLSNAGVIPREFEDDYPYNAYDWDEKAETSEVKRRYVEVTAERIAEYLSAHLKYYLGVACFLKYDSESYQALKIACEKLGIPLKNLMDEETYEVARLSKKPLQEDIALEQLAKEAEWFRQNST